MNQKQAKMLSKIGASKKQVSLFKTLPHDLKGLIRTAYKLNDKLSHPTFGALYRASRG